MGRLTKITFAAILFWATYEVTVTGASLKKETLKIVAVIIALSAAVQLSSALRDWLSSSIDPVKTDVDNILSNRLSVLYDRDVITSNPAVISMHVLEVPILFRRVFAYGFRTRLREIFPLWMQRLAWRPRLVRVGEGGMRRLPPSGVTFRKGYGIVGIALQANENRSIYWVNHNDPKLIEALADGPKKWRDKPSELTQNLRHEAAKRLANRYSEALALVIQDIRTGEALGCLTIEAARGAVCDLRSNRALHAELGATADLLGPVLARKRT